MYYTDKTDTAFEQQAMVHLHTYVCIYMYIYVHVCVIFSIIILVYNYIVQERKKIFDKDVRIFFKKCTETRHHSEWKNIRNSIPIPTFHTVYNCMCVACGSKN